MEPIMPTKNSKNISGDDHEKLVVVEGWVQEVRNLGGISFLVLRDRYGIIQITAPKKKIAPELMEQLSSVPRESVVKISGLVKQSAQAKAGYEIIPSEMDRAQHVQLPAPDGRRGQGQRGGRDPFRQPFHGPQEAGDPGGLRGQVAHAAPHRRVPGAGELRRDVHPQDRCLRGGGRCHPFRDQLLRQEGVPGPVAPAVQADADVDRPGPGLRDRPGVPRRAVRYRQARLRVHLVRRRDGAHQPRSGTSWPCWRHVRNMSSKG